MTQVKTLFVLLLALVLPLKGALAAMGSVCATPAQQPEHAAPATDPHARGHVIAQQHAQHHARAGHAHVDAHGTTSAHDTREHLDTGGHAGEGSADATGAESPTFSDAACSVCIACCSAPVAGLGAAGLNFAPLIAAAQQFPPLASVVPNHLSDGPERPPRSI